MIIVNVGRSWPKAQSEKDRTQALEGPWPIRGANLPPAGDAELANLHLGVHKGIWNQAMAEDVIRLSREKHHELVAVSSNVVVDVRFIEDWDIFDGRLGFMTSVPDWRPAVVGARLPAELAWRRGESWPVKVADSGWLNQVIQTESVDVGDYTVHLLPNGGLHVTLPPAAGIVTVGTHDQPVPTKAPTFNDDAETEYLRQLDEDETQHRDWAEKITARFKEEP